LSLWLRILEMSLYNTLQQAIDLKSEREDALVNFGTNVMKV